MPFEIYRGGGGGGEEGVVVVVVGVKVKNPSVRVRGGADSLSRSTITRATFSKPPAVFSFGWGEGSCWQKERERERKGERRKNLKF